MDQADPSGGNGPASAQCQLIVNVAGGEHLDDDTRDVLFLSNRRSIRRLHRANLCRMVAFTRKPSLRSVNGIVYYPLNTAARREFSSFFSDHKKAAAKLRCWLRSRATMLIGHVTVAPH